MPDERNPKNALGPFYVLNGHCVSCGVPEAEAPQLVTLGDEGCYFHKQPRTDDEIDSAIRAMQVSCIEAYRYAGDDRRIRLRLAELGCGSLCDQPLEQHDLLVRNRVRFLLNAERATDVLLLLLLPLLEKTHERGEVTRGVSGDANRAEIEFDPYNQPRRYRLERLPLGTPRTGAVCRDAPNVATWLLAEDGGRYPPEWLHDLLLELGALHLRWFSHAELSAGAEGSERP